MNTLVEELAAWFEDLGRASAVAEVTVDCTSLDVDLSIEVRPKVAADNKANFGIAVWADTAAMNVGRFGFLELYGRDHRDHRAIADEIEELALAAIEGRVTELLITIGGRPSSGKLEFALVDRTAVFHHSNLHQLRPGRRERHLTQYVAY